MSFSKLLTIVTLAAAVSAASLKRVSCPDGKNTASNGELKQPFVTLTSSDVSQLHAARSLLYEMT